MDPGGEAEVVVVGVIDGSVHQMLIWVRIDLTLVLDLSLRPECISDSCNWCHPQVSKEVLVHPHPIIFVGWQYFLKIVSGILLMFIYVILCLQWN